MEDGKNRLNESRYRSKNRTEVEYAHICSIEKKDLNIFHRRLYIRFEMPQWTKRQQPDFQYISMAANRCIRLRHGLSMMICIQRIFPCASKLATYQFSLLSEFRNIVLSWGPIAVFTINNQISGDKGRYWIYKQ